MKAIVAVNNKGFIGKDGKMMWHSHDDMVHFKNMTKGCKLLVGRKTAETLPKFKDRELHIVSRNKQLIDEVLNKTKIDWVIGGGEIYEQTIHLCNEIHVSIIIDNDDEGDTKFTLPDDYKGEIFYYYFTSDGRK